MAKLPFPLRFQYTDNDNLAIHPIPTTTSNIVGVVKPGDKVEVDQIADGNDGHIMAHDSRGWYSMGTTRIWFKLLPTAECLLEIEKLNTILTQKDGRISTLNKKIANAQTALK